MTLTGIKSLILTQIGIDIFIVAIFIFLIWKFRYLYKNKAFSSAIKMLESVLKDADNITAEFKDQIGKKNNLIKELNEQLDRKIISLNVLLNKADTYLMQGKGTCNFSDNPSYFSNNQADILDLKKKGHKIEEIADILSLPREEVKLVLDLKGKLSRADNKEGAS